MMYARPPLGEQLQGQSILVLIPGSASKPTPGPLFASFEGVSALANHDLCRGSQSRTARSMRKSFMMAAFFNILYFS